MTGGQRRIAAAIAFCLFLAAPAQGAGGTLLWSDEVGPLRRPYDGGRAIAVAGRRTLVTGIVDGTPIVRAYASDSGALLWEHASRPGRDLLYIVAATVRGRKLVVVAAGDPGEAFALDVTTGRLVWRRSVRTSEAAADSRRVFLSRPIAGADLLLRAVDLGTGKTQWRRRVAGGTSYQTFATGDGNLVVGTLGVDSAGADAGEPIDAVVSAYDARTGRLHWRDVVGRVRDDARWLSPPAVAVSRGRVFVVGSLRISRYVSVVVRAYDASTGALVWQAHDEPVGPAPDERSGVAVAVEGDRVLVTYAPVPGNDFGLRAYAASDGRPLWDAGQIVEEGIGVYLVAAGDSIFTASAIEVGGWDVFVRALDARNGTTRWTEQYDRSEEDLVAGLATDGERVFVSGLSHSGGAGVPQLFVRAYAAD